MLAILVESLLRAELVRVHLISLQSSQPILRMNLCWQPSKDERTYSVEREAL
jgi:hypothetical protein